MTFSHVRNLCFGDECDCSRSAVADWRSFLWKGKRGAATRRGPGEGRACGRDPRGLKPAVPAQSKSSAGRGRSPSTRRPDRGEGFRLVRAANGFDCIDPLSVLLADPLWGHFGRQSMGTAVFLVE